MKRARPPPITDTHDTDGEHTDYQSSDLSGKSQTREVRGRRKKHSESSLDPKQSKWTGIFESTHLQRYLFYFIVATFLTHIAFNGALLMRRPEVNFILIFHGVVTPATIILYIVGVLSAVCGWNALFAKHSRTDRLSTRDWFTRFIRMNKYYALLWFLATQATIFGCWKFIFGQNLDSKFRLDDIVRSPKFDFSVRQIVLKLPQLLMNVEIDFSVSVEDAPLSTLQFIGMNVTIFLFVYSIIPAVLLLACVWMQVKYSEAKFVEIN